MPQVGAIVVTPLGKGTIVDTYTLLERVKVKVKLNDGTEDLIQYQVEDIQVTGDIDPTYERLTEEIHHNINPEILAD